jgi:hypothetical protein
MLRMIPIGALRALAVACLSLVALSSCKAMGGSRDSAQAMTINTVSRTYTKTMQELWPAILAALKDLDLRVVEDEHDALGGRLMAQRANKDSVIVEARSVDPRTLHVSVGVDPGDRNMAQIVQDRFAEQLAGTGPNGGAARSTAPAAGPRVEGTYPQSLDACLAAARRTAEALKLTHLQEDVREGSARLEARHPQNGPVSFRMTRGGSNQTQVAFEAGSGGAAAAEDGRGFADRVKAEFERNLR